VTDALVAIRAEKAFMGLSPADRKRLLPPRPCEKAMFKSLSGSGLEARLGLLAV
jgi:hypothetical protein